MIKFIFMFFMFISCSQAQFIEPVVDEQLLPYKEDFEIIVGKNKNSYKLKKVNMYFADLNKNKKGTERTLGMCKGMYMDTTDINIDIEYWKTATDLSKKFTVLHELGHCICTLGHTEIRNGFWESVFDTLKFKLGIGIRKGYLKDGCPASLMHPYEFDWFCMYTHYDYYMQELKQSCQ